MTDSVITLNTTDTIVITENSSDTVIITNNSTDTSNVVVIPEENLQILSVGEPGPPGPGIIAGGDTGMVLTKVSNADFDTEWRSVDALPTQWGNILGDLEDQEDLQGVLDNKADKVVPYETGNLASLTTDGNIEDSGILSTNVVTEAPADHKQYVRKDLEWSELIVDGTCCQLCGYSNPDNGKVSFEYNSQGDKLYAYWNYCDSICSTELGAPSDSANELNSNETPSAGKISFGQCDDKVCAFWNEGNCCVELVSSSVSDLYSNASPAPCKISFWNNECEVYAYWNEGLCCVELGTTVTNELSYNCQPSQDRVSFFSYENRVCAFWNEGNCSVELTATSPVGSASELSYNCQPSLDRISFKEDSGKLTAYWSCSGGCGSIDLGSASEVSMNGSPSLSKISFTDSCINDRWTLFGVWNEGNCCVELGGSYDSLINTISSFSACEQNCAIRELNTPRAVPTNLTVTCQSDTCAELSFCHDFGPFEKLYFNVCGTTDDVNWTSCSIMCGYNYSCGQPFDVALTPLCNSCYCFKVQAYNFYGRGAFSDVVGYDNTTQVNPYGYVWRESTPLYSSFGYTATNDGPDIAYFGYPACSAFFPDMYAYVVAGPVTYPSYCQRCGYVGGCNTYGYLTSTLCDGTVYAYICWQ